MTGQWVVVLRGGERNEGIAGVYGPIKNSEEADAFAAYMTAEIDPAEAMQLRSPLDELLAFYGKKRFDDPWRSNRPEFWPPQPGTVWQDRHGRRWIGAAGHDGYLVCLTEHADGNAEEVWRLHGPMKFVQIISTSEEEPPF